MNKKIIAGCFFEVNSMIANVSFFYKQFRNMGGSIPGSFFEAVIVSCDPEKLESWMDAIQLEGKAS